MAKNNDIRIYIHICHIHFISIFIFFLELGDIFPQPLLLEVFECFLLKHIILYNFVIFHK